MPTPPPFWSKLTRCIGKGDTPATHLSAKDAAKERELDESLVDPSPLPDWLSDHNRKASRVCVEVWRIDCDINRLLKVFTWLVDTCIRLTH